MEVSCDYCLGARISFPVGLIQKRASKDGYTRTVKDTARDMSKERGWKSWSEPGEEFDQCPECIKAYPNEDQNY